MKTFFSSSGTSQSSSNSEGPRRLQLSDKPPIAVIITIVSGSSYDDLFESTPQISPDPDRSVYLFQFSYEHLQELIDHLNGIESRSSFASVLTAVRDAIAQVDHDSVVFNFECCSSCSSSGFGGEQRIRFGNIVMSLLSWIIAHRHTAMFGDFSLKSLIKDWSVKDLGPNPFIQVGETSSNIDLRFDPNDLLECSNAQLQNVGRMCESGQALLHVMSGTIVFDVNLSAADNPLYTLQILTRSGQGASSTAAHVILHYGSGASILVSAGHWIELNNLNGATEESVMRTCGMQLGERAVDEMRLELQSASTTYEREQIVQKNAQRVVWSSAPCKYSSNS